MSGPSQSHVIGKYKGSGKGSFPTIADFEYTELVEFTSVEGKPFLVYNQKTWNKDNKPLHCESGFMRFLPNGSVELVVAEPTGVTEVYTCKYSVLASESDDPQHIYTFTSESIQRTPTAKPPKTTNVIREFTFNKNSCTYNLSMATEKTPEMTHHLNATLLRQ